jgi:hypothetical protein
MTATPFVDALARASRALRDAGFPSAPLAVFVHPDDVQRIQREFDVGRAMVDQAFRPSNPKLAPGVRFLAEVHGVFIYVRGQAP